MEYLYHYGALFSVNEAHLSSDGRNEPNYGRCVITLSATRGRQTLAQSYWRFPVFVFPGINEQNIDLLQNDNIRWH